jgi:hypothetical protein
MASSFKRPLVATCLIIAGTLAYAAPAAAQATRTWVSGVGDDVNPCSRTAPCKTFAGAISKTATGGEIDCLDPGGFGTLTVTKSITIDCSGTFGSTLNSGGINGFVVNDSATATPGTAKVILRGLSINGAGTTQGLNGIRFISGAVLVVEDVIIQNNSNYGISFQPAGPAKLFVKHVTIADNTGVSGGGVLLQPTGTGSAQAELTNVSIINTAGTGVRADATGNTGTLGITVQLDDVESVGNATGIFLFAPGGNTAPIKAMVADSTIANNSGAGVLANGTPITALFTNTQITANLQGVTVSGATVLSYQNNHLFGNGSNNAFPGTIPQN